MTKPRASAVSVNPSGLVVVTGTDVQAAIAELDAAVGGSGYTDEQVRDVIAAALVAGTGMSVDVNDAGDTITLSSTGGSAGGTAGPTVLGGGDGVSSIIQPPLTDVDDVIVWITRGQAAVTPPFSGTEIEDSSASSGNLYSYGWHRLTAADLNASWVWSGAKAISAVVYRGVIGTPAFDATTKITSLASTGVTLAAKSSLLSTDRVVRLIGTASNGDPTITFSSGAAQRAGARNSQFWATAIADARPSGGSVAAVVTTFPGTSDYIYTSIVLPGA